MNDLIELIESVLGKSVIYRNNEVAFYCPYCNHHKKKLQINLVNQMWHCWVCEKKGRGIKTLFYDANADQSKIAELRKFKAVEYEPRDKQEEDSVTLPQEFIPLYNPDSRLQSQILVSALMYLKSRGITKHDIVRYGIGYCERGEYAGRLIIPSYDENGTLNYFISRSFYVDEAKKYKNPPISKNIVGLEQFINWNMPVVLVEGIFDAIAIRRNAIPLFGKTIPEKLLETIVKNKCKHIYICLDNDAKDSAIKSAKNLLKHDINVYIVNLHQKDPSEIGFVEMTQILKNTTPTTESELMKMSL